MAEAEVLTAIFESIPQIGMSGAVIVILAYQVRYLQTKLVDVIEKNTVALSELRGIIDKCQITHREK